MQNQKVANSKKKKKKLPEAEPVFKWVGVVFIDHWVMNTIFVIWLDESQMWYHCRLVLQFTMFSVNRWLII